jgi:hypothetical protein
MGRSTRALSVAPRHGSARSGHGDIARIDSDVRVRGGVEVMVYIRKEGDTLVFVGGSRRVGFI